jgi:hypothetical protein
MKVAIGTLVPIDTLPVEIRIKIYELGDFRRIYDDDEIPWMRTILMSGILNDKDAIEIAAIQGEETREIICEVIAVSGNLPMMKWARSDKVPVKDDTAAVEDRSMKQTRLTPLPWSAMTCANAMRFLHFKLLKWLHEQGCPWDEETFRYAACCGSIEVLEWLYQNNCPWDSETFGFAAELGTLDVMKWLHERGCPWNDTAYSDVLINQNAGNLASHLEMVQWLHEIGCPLNEDACTTAAMIGNLEILKWLREQGCPWDRERILRYARDLGYDDMYLWTIFVEDESEDEDSNDSNQGDDDEDHDGVEEESEDEDSYESDQGEDEDGAEESEEEEEESDDLDQGDDEDDVDEADD